MAWANDCGGQSTSPAGRDFANVERTEDVYDSCGRDKTRAVVARRARDVGTGGLEDTGEEIENARASVGEKAESTERIIRMQRKYVAAHYVSGNCQAANSGKKKYRASWTAQNQMA